MLAGLAQPRLWLSQALRCLLLDPQAYRRVGRDRFMTGPALLIALLSLVGSSLIRQNRFDPLLIFGNIALWFLATLLVYAAGHLLSRQGSFTRTFRALAFARVTTVLELFALVPPLASAALAVTMVASFLAMWLAAATAHNLKGWRAAVLPLLVLFVYILGAILIASLAEGADFTLHALLAAFSLTPQ